MVESEPNYEEAPQSWTSWAWSYVPQILPTEDDFEYEDEEAVRAKRKNEPSALVVGFCVNKGSVIFKVSVHLEDSIHSVVYCSALIELLYASLAYRTCVTVRVLWPWQSQLQAMHGVVC